MPRTFLALAALAALALAACNDDGRTLAPAPTVPVSPETTTTLAEAPDPGFSSDVGLVISSPSFTHGGALPRDFTCDGFDVAPPLDIAGVPHGTAELAIAVVDRDADGFVHWVVAGIDPQVRRIDSGVLPAGAVTALSSSGRDGWDGPCPPEGDAAHDYVFTVYAMVEPAGMSPGLDGRAAIELLDAAAGTRAETIATYATATAG